MVMIDQILDFDIWVELFSLVITLFIVGFSYRAYRLTKQKRNLYFSFAFLLISAGLFLTILFNSIIDFEETPVLVRGFLPISHIAGLLLFSSMLCITAGTMTIFLLNEQLKSRKTIFLLFMFVFLSTVVAHYFYFTYHLVLFIILSLILNYYTWHYKKLRTTISLLIMLAFAGLTISQAVMFFIPYATIFYVIGHAIQLVSYILLLFMFIILYRK